MQRPKTSNLDADERWKPQHQQHYFVILGDYTIQRFQWSETDFDQRSWQCGNCFRVRRDAEHVLEQIKEVFRNFHKAQGT
jgi:hypothetical protein